MLWLDGRKAPEPPDGSLKASFGEDGHHGVTDDPLAAIDIGGGQGQQKIYSVSRSVHLPRVSLKNSTVVAASGGGVNPLYRNTEETVPKHPHNEKPSIFCHIRSPSGEKSASSGYGGSHGNTSSDAIYVEHLKLLEDAPGLLEQNPSFVKAIRIPGRGNKTKSNSGSSGGGTLTTIPEGKIDATIPQPIWPPDERFIRHHYDSLVDDALLLYTSLSYHPDRSKYLDTCIDLSVKDMLVELLASINQTLEGHNNATPEETLKIINEKIRQKLETLKHTTEEEMKRLCVNLSNCKKINSVLRAFSNSSSSGNSSQSTDYRMRTSSTDEDIYQIPSGSSSSGFSDSLKDTNQVLPAVFVHDDFLNVPNCVRNAMIYGTLCRGKNGERLLDKAKKVSAMPKKSLLRSSNDEKPSVWEQYYGVRAVPDGGPKYASKPSDVPLFPGGRPEADFTLDVPRSELLSKRMKQDKRWRCRCRLLTSFLGIVFFLLSVMAVSLMLTRGKRMFGSMV